MKSGIKSVKYTGPQGSSFIILQANPSRNDNLQLFTPHSSLLGRAKSTGKVFISFVTDPLFNVYAATNTE